MGHIESRVGTWVESVCGAFPGYQSQHRSKNVSAKRPWPSGKRRQGEHHIWATYLLPKDLAGSPFRHRHTTRGTTRNNHESESDGQSNSRTHKSPRPDKIPDPQVQRHCSLPPCHRHTRTHSRHLRNCSRNWPLPQHTAHSTVHSLAPSPKSATPKRSNTS